MSSRPGPQDADPAHPPLIHRYRQVRDLSGDLARPLTDGVMAVQTIPEVSPSKWHLAHTTWFFERMVLAEQCSGYQPVDERYWFLFNSYYYSVGEMHLRAERGAITRPTVAEVMDYRAEVDERLCALLAERDGEPELAGLVTLGLNHEQQHQELMLTDIKHVLAADPERPAYREDLPTPTGSAGELGWWSHPEGVVEVGLPATGEGFRYDNETPRHRTYLQAHRIADRLVTNAEYRAFIRDGGYDDCRLWLADGWARIREEAWRRPLYWDEDLVRSYTLAGERELVDDAPVQHLSFYEAEAYARWAGARLPTEFEWEIAAVARPEPGNTLESGLLDPAPADGGHQLHGDVWEWTSSAYAAYPGFRPLAGSLGEYNGKFMCSQMTVRGGSCLSKGDHLRPTYRSFFYPQDRWQALGLRLAQDGS